MAFVALSFVVIAALIAGVMMTASTTVSARDVAWLAGGVERSPAETDVYSEYLGRHRRHRALGGLFGALFALTIGIRWYSSVSIGIGDGSPMADILFCTLTGVLAGALSAETFRLSEPNSTTIAASLVERDGPPRTDLVRIARGLSLATLVIALIIAVTDHGLTSLWIAAASLVLALVAEVTRAAIAGRRRPVLSERAQHVDLQIRSFAATSVALLQLAAAVLTAGWVVAKADDITNDALLLLRFFVVIGCLVLTVILLFRASPRPPRGWQPPAS